METTYSVGEFAKKLHKTVRTIQQWDRDGLLVACRTPTNRRFYTHDQLLRYFGCDIPVADRRVVAYCRVSSSAQRPDLLNQRTVLEQYCAAKGYAGVEFVTEVGGGMNFKRKRFREIMTLVHEGKVATIVVAHRDRLARFGFDHIEWECRLNGCRVEVLNQQQMSPEQEMVQDLMTIVHCFSSRLYGLRNYRKALRKALSP